MIDNKSQDLYFTEDCDLFFDDGINDISLTKTINNETLLNILKLRLQSSSEDWEIVSPVFSNINYLTGLPRNKETIDSLKSLVFNTITEDFLIDPEDVFVEFLGVQDDIAGFGVIINAIDRDVNSRVELGFSYDFRENRFTIINTKY